MLWAFETTSGIWSKPLLHNGVLYITSMDHNLYAIDSAMARNCGGSICKALRPARR